MSEGEIDILFSDDRVPMAKEHPLTDEEYLNERKEVGRLFEKYFGANGIYRAVVNNPEAPADD